MTDTEIKLILPKSMEDTWKRLLVLQEAAANGDRQAKKVLDFAKNYSSRPFKMDKRP